MLITVTTERGVQISLAVHASDTVASVKVQLNRHVGMACRVLVLREALDDNRTLSDYNITSGACLFGVFC